MAKKKAKKKPARFLVGYGQRYARTLYGQRFKCGDSTDYCRAMTELQAQRLAKRMPCDGAVLYELVPVK